MTSKEDQYYSGFVSTSRSYDTFLSKADLQEVTATEDQFYSGFINTRHLLSLSLDQLDEEQQKLYRLENNRCWRDMTVPIEDCKEVSITKYITQSFDNQLGAVYILHNRGWGRGGLPDLLQYYIRGGGCPFEDNS